MSLFMAQSLNGKVKAMVLVQPLSENKPNMYSIDIWLAPMTNKTLCSMLDNAYIEGLPDSFTLKPSVSITKPNYGYTMDHWQNIVKVLVYLLQTPKQAHDIETALYSIR